MSNDQRKATDRIDVRYVANLARLDLTDAEVLEFQGQLDHIVEYVNSIRGLDVEGVEPMAHATVVQNVFRDDVVKPGLAAETALANAPQHQSGLFMVPKIVE